MTSRGVSGPNIFGTSSRAFSAIDILARRSCIHAVFDSASGKLAAVLASVSDCTTSLRRLNTSSAIALPLALPLFADTVTDVKSALRNLRAAAPIRAAYETKSANVAKGRFFDQDVSTSAAVEARVDDNGITIVYPRAMLERAAAQRDAKKDDAKQRVADVSATRIAEMLDYAPAL